MNIQEILEKLDQAPKSTEIVVLCGSAEYGIDHINTDSEIVLGKEKGKNVGDLRDEFMNLRIPSDTEILLRMDKDSFEIDMIVLDNQPAIYNQDESGLPKLLIFPENTCIEKYGLHSFMF